MKVRFLLPVPSMTGLIVFLLVVVAIILVLLFISSTEPHQWTVDRDGIKYCVKCGFTGQSSATVV